MNLLPTQELGKLAAKGVQVFPSETNHFPAMPRRERSSQSELGTSISPKKQFFNSSAPLWHHYFGIEACHCLRYRFIGLITEGTAVPSSRLVVFSPCFGNLHLKSQVSSLKSIGHVRP